MKRDPWTTAAGILTILTGFVMFGMLVLFGSEMTPDKIAALGGVLTMCITTGVGLIKASDAKPPAPPPAPESKTPEGPPQ